MTWHCPGNEFILILQDRSFISMFLVAVDGHSRWLEVERMSSTTSEKTIETLHILFARYGVSAQLVSNNEPQLKNQKSLSSSSRETESNISL